MKRVKIKLGTAVRVTWLDSYSTVGRVWLERREAELLGTPAIHAIGFLLADKPSHITLASHMGDEQVSGVMVIPRGCIVHMTKLR